MKPKVFILTSHPMSVLAFMLPHIRTLNPYVDLSVSANTLESDLLSKRGVDIPVDYVPIVRKISLIKDIKALSLLLHKFILYKPHVVHTVTPKAGLLGMLAAWLTRVPVRIHSFTGQVWVTRRGLMRWFLKTADRLIARLATDVLVDSPSQREFLISQNITKLQSCIVLGSGSICGVDTKRFSPNLLNRNRTRIDMGSGDDVLILLYLGRLNRDKGVIDLANAFAKLARCHPKCELWIVGPDEGNWFEKMLVILEHCAAQVKRVGYTEKPEEFMQAADLFCLPSYREGFGSVVIEAAACGVPALVSRIYGLTDAVIDGQTGWMHEAGNVNDLIMNLENILSNPGCLKFMGANAREYVDKYFSQDFVSGEMISFYKSKLNI